ncbi:MAG: flippase [Cytophagales bacterium]
MSNLKKNFLYNSLISISQILIPILTYPYASKVLGVETIGSVSFADAISKVFMLVSSIGIPIYGVRSIAKCKENFENLKKTFQEIFILHIFATTIFGIFFLFVVSNLKQTSENIEFYYISLIATVLNIFSFEWYFMGVEKFKTLSIRYIFLKLFFGILVFILIKTPQDKYIYFTLTLGMFVGNSVLNIFILKRELFNFISFSKLNLKSHLKPLFYIFISNAAITIYLFLDTIILGLISNNTNVGLYSVALKIAKIPLILVSTISNVVFPKISSSIHQKNNEEATNLLEYLLSIYSTLLIPISIGLFVISKEIIIIFSNEEYLAASFTLKILCFIIPFIGLSNIFGIQILTSLSKDKQLTFAVTCGMFISIILNYILAKKLNENGTAIATLSSELVVCMITYYMAKKQFEFKLNIKNILYNVIICSLFLVIYNVINNKKYTPTTTIILTIIGCSLYYIFIQYFILKNPIFVQLEKLFKKNNSERI